MTRSVGQHRGSTSFLRLAVVALLVGILLALAAAAAKAHAYVEASVPADGAVLDEAPEQIRVVFDSTVQAPIAAIRVYNSDSERVDADDARLDPTNSRAVVGALQPDVPDGPYVVTWRALSLDGHTIIGSFTFFVGPPTGLVPADITPQSVSPVVTTVATGLRVAIFGGLLVCAGAGFLHLVSVRRRDQRWRRAKSSLIGLVSTSAQVVVVASALSLPVHAIATSGAGVVDSLIGDPFLRVLAEPFGMAGLARIIVLLPFAGRMRTRSPLGVSLLWVTALATLAIDGHSVTQQPGVTFISDLVHVLSAAIWVGGLAGLAVVLRTMRAEADPHGIGSVVRTFSDIAALAVVATAASGILMASVTVGPVDEAPATGYGRTLIVKLLLVVVVLGVAAWNRFVLLPRLADSEPSRVSLASLRRTTRLELAALGPVVVATAILVSMPPAPPAPRLVAEVTADGIVAAADPNALTAEDILRTVLLVAGVGALAARGTVNARHGGSGPRPAPRRRSLAGQRTLTPPQNAT